MDPKLTTIEIEQSWENLPEEEIDGPVAERAIADTATRKALTWCIGKMEALHAEGHAHNASRVVMYEYFEGMMAQLGIEPWETK